jgi:hypothetical protein
VTRYTLANITLVEDTKVQLSFNDGYKLIITPCIQTDGPIRLRELALKKGNDVVCIVKAPRFLYLSSIPPEFKPYWAAALRDEGTWLLTWKAGIVRQAPTPDQSLAREHALRPLKKLQLQ